MIENLNFAAVDVGEAESDSPAPRTVHQSGRRNRVMVYVVGPSQDGSIIDFTSTGAQQVTGSSHDFSALNRRGDRDMPRMVLTSDSSFHCRLQ